MGSPLFGPSFRTKSSRAPWPDRVRSCADYLSSPGGCSWPDCEFAAAPGSCPSVYGPGRPRAAFSVNQEFTLSGQELRSHRLKIDTRFRLAADVRLRPVECRRLPRAVVESFRGGRPGYFEKGRSPNASSKSDFGVSVHSAVSTYEPGAIPSERLHPKGANSRIRPTAVRRSRDLSARQPPFAGTRRGMAHWNLRQSEAWQHPREPQVSHRRGRARNVRHLCHAADDRTFQHARRRPATA